MYGNIRSTNAAELWPNLKPVYLLYRNETAESGIHLSKRALRVGDIAVKIAKQSPIIFPPPSRMKRRAGWSARRERERERETRNLRRISDAFHVISVFRGAFRCFESVGRTGMYMGQVETAKYQ